MPFVEIKRAVDDMETLDSVSDSILLLLLEVFLWVGGGEWGGGRRDPSLQFANE